jgi:hypothetical protein
VGCITDLGNGALAGAKIPGLTDAAKSPGAGSQEERSPEVADLCFPSQAPQLETVGFDRFFDRFSRERVGRRLVRTHNAGRSPRRMIAGKLCSRRIARECPQILRRLRFENIHSHNGGIPCAQCPDRESCSEPSPSLVTESSATRSAAQHRAHCHTRSSRHHLVGARGRLTKGYSGCSYKRRIPSLSNLASSTSSWAPLRRSSGSSSIANRTASAALAKRR